MWHVDFVGNCSEGVDGGMYEYMISVGLSWIRLLVYSMSDRRMMRTMMNRVSFGEKLEAMINYSCQLSDFLKTVWRRSLVTLKHSIRSFEGVHFQTFGTFC